MRFTVFAIASVPDTQLTRRLFGLADLDDKSVSKVLFHRRKQQTGDSEVLRWDQRVIAGLSLLQHAAGEVRMASMTLAAHTEQDMLQAFYAAAVRDAQLVSWDGERAGLPLLHFRTLTHGLCFPAYWQARAAGDGVHLDLCDWLSPPGTDRPLLDETARKLGFPGLLGRSEGSVYDAWLAARYGEVQAYADIVALNSFLLALRVLHVTGRLAEGDGARAGQHLREILAETDQPHATEFLDAWGNA
jgi:predicted PolB exonuclease-like 3'-5' exonuclease